MSPGLPWETGLAGRLDRAVIESTLLKDNPLGDPHVRPVWVYLPPGYDDRPETRYPTVYVLQGYTGFLSEWGNRTAYRQPFPETADALFASGEAPPCVVVFVDAWTAYGGSQFVDSPGTGPYHSYLCDEVVPWVDGRYRTIADRGSRAISGKSSGGFGAMITPMLRPDLFGALASHSGDALYEYWYFTLFADAVRFLRDFDHDITAWWKDFRSRVSFTNDADSTLMMVLGCSACFSADPDGTPVLPFDPRTGALRPDVWNRWRAWDPVHMAERYADALTSLRAIWLDAGTRDEIYLDIGATAFHAELQRIGVPDDRIHFELFDAGHEAIDYRYPLALAWLAKRLAR
jgi:S-formylglutathione hydrolase FrmB